MNKWKGFCCGSDRLRHRGSIPKAAMGPGGVLVDSPPFDQDLRLFENIEDLAVEQFISEFAVEALVVAGLPGTPALVIV